jgi:hypothetical protein
MNHQSCPRCGAYVQIPPELKSESKTKFAEIARGRGRVPAMMWLSQELKIELKTAKGIIAHFVVSPGWCQRCGEQLPQGELVSCIKCGSLNITW